MARLALLPAAVLVATVAAAPAQSLDPRDLRAALEDALAPALPFPAALEDGTPASGDTTPVWTLRWAPDGAPRVEALANPLNEGNRQRALAVEQAIQTAAMQAQRRSQSDYEQALSDFQRTGRTSEIREITLRDDGVAGERYDAESQVTVSAAIVDAPRVLAVDGGTAPHIVDALPGTAAVVRVPANTYLDEGAAGLAEAPHYAPEQAWILVGGLTADAAPGSGRAAPAVTVTPAAGGRGVLVWIRGNADLVEQVVTRGAWAAFRARVGG